MSFSSHSHQGSAQGCGECESFWASIPGLEPSSKTGFDKMTDISAEDAISAASDWLLSAEEDADDHLPSLDSRIALGAAYSLLALAIQGQPKEIAVDWAGYPGAGSDLNTQADALLAKLQPAPEDVNDHDLPGMWTQSDFLGGDPDPRGYAQRERDKLQPQQPAPEPWRSDFPEEGPNDGLAEALDGLPDGAWIQILDDDPMVKRHGMWYDIDDPKSLRALTSHHLSGDAGDEPVRLLAPSLAEQGFKPLKLYRADPNYKIGIGTKPEGPNQ